MTCSPVLLLSLQALQPLEIRHKFKLNHRPCHAGFGARADLPEVVLKDAVVNNTDPTLRKTRQVLQFGARM